MTSAQFSPTYAEARHRFLAAAASIDANIVTYPIGSTDPDLAIDVATVGGEGLPTVVTSSGVHGVEGFLGSAVQLALLERLRTLRGFSGIRFVLIHSINPYGFAHLRRFNEDGIDLNRNFQGRGESYSGAPEAYSKLNHFLNPEAPPSRFEPFALKALWLICRHGMQTLKEAVARGQYEYPDGVFFGGKQRAASTRIVQNHCDDWIGPSKKIIHFDIHSGLGKFAAYKLLLGESPASPNFPWYVETFGTDCVETLADPAGTGYKVSGLFVDWMQEHFREKDYRSIGFEFGTYNVIRVLAAIRNENRAHLYGSEKTESYRRAKQELLECFCPASETWRSRAIESGLKVINEAIKRLLKAGGHRSARDRLTRILEKS